MKNTGVVSIMVEDRKVVGFIANETVIDKETQILLMKLLFDAEVTDVHEASAEWEKTKTELASKNETAKPVN